MKHSGTTVNAKFGTENSPFDTFSATNGNMSTIIGTAPHQRYTTQPNSTIHTQW